MIRKNSLAAVLFLSAGVLFAALPPRPIGNVSDFAGVLDEKTVSEMTALAVDLEKKTSDELAVVTIDSLEGRDIESAAAELMKTWGIGKKDKNNGILILTAVQDRKVRIEVGYGLEGILPDGRCGEIIRQVMVPRFKEGDYNAGIYGGVLAAAGVIAEDAGVTLDPRARPPRTKEQNRKTALMLMIPVFILMAVLSQIFENKRRRQGGYMGGMFYGGMGGGGFGGGGFGGFGGGFSGGGGASGSW